MFNIKVVTPKGIKKDVEAKYCEFTTIEGGMGVLSKRLPIITKLKITSLKIIDRNGKEELLAIHSGILDMDGEELVVLTTDAEKPEEINVETALKAVEDAKELLKTEKDYLERTKILANIEKNMVRVNIKKSGK